MLRYTAESTAGNLKDEEDAACRILASRKYEPNIYW